MSDSTPNPSTKQCLQCGKSFRIKPSHYDLRVHCSKECMAIAYAQKYSGKDNPNYKNAAARICITCGKGYESYDKGRKYCSIRCRPSPPKNRVEKICLHCGKIFEIKRSHADGRFFCSNPCRLTYRSLHKKQPKPKVVRLAKLPPPPKPPKIPKIVKQKIPRVKQRFYCKTCGVEIGGKKASVCRKCFREAHTKCKQTCVVCGRSFKGYKKTCSTECRNTRRGQMQRGDKSHRWRGGKTELARRLRNEKSYAEWRTKVFQRDDYICQLCHNRGGKLAAHHIKLFSTHRHLSLVVENGVTLCWSCHQGIKTKEQEYEVFFFSITGGIPIEYHQGRLFP